MSGKGTTINKMKNTIQYLLAGVLLIGVTAHSSGQHWNTNGNTILGGEWFGADAASTIALDIRHRANFPMFFSTNNTNRMSILQYGNVGVGTFQNPLSRKH